MHQKYVEVNDSLERVQGDGGFKRVDLGSDSGCVDVQEDALEQRRPVTLKEIKWEDAPKPPSEDCEAFHQRLVPDPAQPTEAVQLEANKGGEDGAAVATSGACLGHIAEEYRILESVNFQVGTCTP